MGRLSRLSKTQLFKNIAKYPNLWVTRKGDLMRIKDMSSEHIINTLAFIERTDKIDALLGHKIAFIEELNKRGVKHDFEP